MDIISLSKASKALKNAQKLDEVVVAKGAEDRFTTVDGRMDWIESQFSNALINASIKYKLEDGDFDKKKTEYVGNSDTVQLKKVLDGSSPLYTAKGVYTTDVIDLGEGWQETKRIEMLIEKFNYTDIVVKYATSTDGVTFTSMQAYSSSSLPQTRYIQFEFAFTGDTVSASNQSVSVVPFDQQSKETTVIADKNIDTSSGEVKIKTAQELLMQEDTNWSEEGSLHSILIKRSEYRRIDSLEVSG